MEQWSDPRFSTSLGVYLSVVYIHIYGQILYRCGQFIKICSYNCPGSCFLSFAGRWCLYFQFHRGAQLTWPQKNDCIQ